jgi:hypothetical protein
MESSSAGSQNGNGCSPSPQLDVAKGGSEGEPVRGAVPGNRLPRARGVHGKRGDRADVSDPDVRIGPTVTERLEQRARRKLVSNPYDPATEEGCPLLWDFVTRFQNSKGEERLLPEIVLKRADGGWLVTIRDCDTNQQTVCFTETFLDLSNAIERHFASGRDVWTEYKNRANPDGIERKRKKKD